MMSEKFTEYSNTGVKIRLVMEIVMFGVEMMFNVTFKEPPHDIALKFLNHISEFKPEALQDQEARLRAALPVRENADKSGG
jgi:hypothetical protein